MDERVGKVEDLLHEAAETHHVVSRIVDGADDDWASWYTNWLVDHSELPEILGSRPVPSELTWMLVQLDKEYSNEAPRRDVGGPVRAAPRLPLHFLAPTCRSGATTASLVSAFGAVVRYCGSVPPLAPLSVWLGRGARSDGQTPASTYRRVGARRARRGMLHGHILVGSFLGQHARAFGRGVDGG